MFDWLRRFIDWWCKPRHRRQSKRKVYDIRTPEFHTLAEKVSGLKWDFFRLGNGHYRCCVENCFRGILYGHWTCEKHRPAELAHFHAVDEYGNTFWSHKS